VIFASIWDAFECSFLPQISALKYIRIDTTVYNQGLHSNHHLLHFISTLDLLAISLQYLSDCLAQTQH
jgi:hypothetical protein